MGDLSTDTGIGITIYAHTIELIRVLIWPIITLVLVFVLKKPFIDFIQNINRIKYKDIELELFKNIEKISYVEEGMYFQEKEWDALEKHYYDNLLTSLKSNPRIIIMREWKEILRNISKIFEIKNIKEKDKTYPILLKLEKLKNDEIIQVSYYEQLILLSKLYNLIKNDIRYKIDETNSHIIADFLAHSKIYLEYLISNETA